MCNTVKDLQDELTDYFGTALFSGHPAAIADLIRVQEASQEELESMASQCGIDLSHR